jgi:hypothetical protein
VDARDELLTIAEIAVGLAGFSGVVAAFMQRGGLSLLDRTLFLVLFSTAFVALFLAFVPIALARAGLEGEPLWRASSIAMGLVWIVGMIPYPFGMRELRQKLPSMPPPPRIRLVLYFGPAFATFLLQVGNAGEWFWDANFLPYLFGMLQWLYHAAFTFVIIILFRPED